MTELNNRTTQNIRHRRILCLAKTGILAALATVLMYLEFPLPLPIFPTFLKLDLADVPALYGAFAMGPWTGVLIQLLRNILHLPATATMMVGELANFIMGGFFVFTCGMIYKYHKTKRGAILSMIFGVLALTVSGVLVNYWLTLPFYAKAMGFPLEAVIGLAVKAGNTCVTDLKTLLLYVFVPFNLIKGFLVTLIVGLTYKRLSPFLHY